MASDLHRRGRDRRLQRDECLFCTLARDDAGDEAQIIERNDLVYAVLNAYPYTSGHLMVVPVRHEDRLETLTVDEAGALIAMVQAATQAVQSAYGPEGINVGMNLGRAAGAGVPGHLHVHVVPRWVGDTNFMTSIAETRVLPEPLSTTCDRLRSRWPAAVASRPMSDEPGDRLPDDRLPEDLDVTAYVGPYLFPDIRRRRIAGVILAVLGAASLAAGSERATTGSSAVGVLLLLVGAYHFAGAWHLEVDQIEALAVASRTVGFPVGPRLRAARVAGPAITTVVAHPPLQRRRPALDARPRRGRRGRRLGAR